MKPCVGQTGHAEAVRITFDGLTITYPKLLEIFFTIHDPTTLNRQGNDKGTQYRSAIFYRDPSQLRTAEPLIKTLTAEQLHDAPIITQVVAAGPWDEAEPHYQEYFA